MGGAIRRITRIFSPPAYTPPAAQIVSAAPAAAKTTISGTSMAKVRGAGSGITGTIMTDSMGITEDEANVAKAELGEGKKKKKYL